ncbi:C40 family peptidase [Clostridium sp. CM028]|nr:MULTISPECIES: C40 family peptidase [unclassified Clostridium]MBW9145426.1 C40 family peptidase [Clostridium sp. CM027]MBW9148756.1 C40 family peptidase [Clostridium sp. CM028]UVE39406.1 C40 family peptidase [Clostridium sp. CM027]WLC63138.1 C40 family peptidase [Clostridium sp. CM028]
MRRRILPLLIAIGLVMSVSKPMFAVSLTQQLDNQKKQLLEQQGSYSLSQKNSDQLEISIEMLDLDIGNMNAGIDKAKNEIYSTEKKIEKTTKDIVVAEHNIKGEESVFNERMRAMYMNGADSYLEILLDSEGVEDLISRVENVKKIVEYDNKIIKELNEKKKIIEDRKKALNDKKVKVLALKANNEIKLDELSAKKKEQGLLVVEANKQEELNKNEMIKIQASVDSTTNQIKDEADQKRKYDMAIDTKKTQENTPSRGQVSTAVKNETNDEKEIVEEVSKPKPTLPKPTLPKPTLPKPTLPIGSNEVIEYAKTFLGTPYVWGATGPNSFDCSGFTQYVYAHFGVTTGRDTYAQITHGSYVSRENLQPGDLVFFGSGSPHHVGIYVGNNSYIHAPSTGDVVKISQLTRSDYMSARRVR